MKLKYIDGIVRNFKPSHFDGEPFNGKKQGGTWESKCLGCGFPFGVHDTKILKPLWKKHICKSSGGAL